MGKGEGIGGWEDGKDERMVKREGREKRGDDRSGRIEKRGARNERRRIG
jgi:hypothetical protein